MLGGACLPGSVAVMQATAVPVAMDGSVTSQPGPQQQQQQHLEQQPQQQLQQQQQQRPHLEDIDVDLEADECLQHDDSEDMQQASPPRRVTRHAAAVAAAASSAKAGPIKRSTPTKRKAAGAGDDQVSSWQPVNCLADEKQACCDGRRPAHDSGGGEGASCMAVMYIYSSWVRGVLLDAQQRSRRLCQHIHHSNSRICWPC